jgi:hypothetical protein
LPLFRAVHRMTRKRRYPPPRRFGARGEGKRDGSNRIWL